MRSCKKIFVALLVGSLFMSVATAKADEDVNHLLRDKNWDELVKMGRPAVCHIVDYLKFLNKSERAEAADALGKINDYSAIGALIKLLNDECKITASRAAIALKKISGQDFGTDQSEWIAWWENYNIINSAPPPPSPPAPNQRYTNPKKNI